MREIGIEEHKAIQLEILKYFAQFCEDNNLRYFLAYGTLIGAIRHKGFIPWDDDTDVQMPRPDYEKLIEIFNEKSKDTHYYLVSPYDPISKHTMLKIIDTRTVKIEPGITYENGYLGVDIDVFVIDGQPDGDDDYKKYYNRLMLEYKKFLFSQMPVNEGKLRRKIVLPVLKLLIGPKETILKKTDAIHSKYKYEESNYVGSVCCLYSQFGNRNKKECFEKFIYTEYEGLQFRVPAGYDEILRSIYGDYMQLPPIEEQCTHHTNTIYWKD